MTDVPLVVGIGGTTRPGSSSERAMSVALMGAEAAGATTTVFDGPALELPMYRPGAACPPAAVELIDAFRRADGIVLASPGYHGTVSGLVKNALDYTEEMRDDDRPYFQDRAVGCIGVAYGWQAAVATLGTLRSIVHALRGWPTPLGVAVNSSHTSFGPDGACLDDDVGARLALLGAQVVDFASAHAAVERR